MSVCLSVCLAEHIQYSGRSNFFGSFFSAAAGHNTLNFSNPEIENFGYVALKRHPTDFKAFKLRKGGSSREVRYSNNPPTVYSPTTGLFQGRLPFLRFNALSNVQEAEPN